MVEPGEETTVEEIKEEEVATAMNRMKRGKAVGPDNIPVEAWKVLGWLGVEILRHIFEDHGRKRYQMSGGVVR